MQIIFFNFVRVKIFENRLNYSLFDYYQKLIILYIPKENKKHNVAYLFLIYFQYHFHFHYLIRNHYLYVLSYYTHLQ